MCAPQDGQAANTARLKRQVMEEVKSYFRPELLNRFDEQVRGLGRGWDGRRRGGAATCAGSGPGVQPPRHPGPGALPPPPRR
jgi:hypothetical protein